MDQTVDPECKFVNALFLPYIVVSLYGGGNVIGQMMQTEWGRIAIYDRQLRNRWLG